MPPAQRDVGSDSILTLHRLTRIFLFDHVLYKNLKVGTLAQSIAVYSKIIKFLCDLLKNAKKHCFFFVKQVLLPTDTE